MIDSEVIRDAFLHCEERKVDKAGCISFMGRKYEVGLLFLGRKVNIIYDPQDISVLTIECDGHAPWQARELAIGERAGKRPKMPEHLTKLPADSSRLLKGAQKKAEDQTKAALTAISYRTLRKEAAADV